MNREQMIEKAAEALRWERVQDGSYQERLTETDDEVRQMASDVIAAILPQVTTVEELEALPVGTHVLAADGATFRKNAGQVYPWYCMSNGFDYRSSDVLDGPELTVVWQP